MDKGEDIKRKNGFVDKMKNMMDDFGNDKRLKVILLNIDEKELVENWRRQKENIKN